MAALAAPHSPTAVDHSRASTEPIDSRPTTGHGAANTRHPRGHSILEEIDARAGPCSFRQMTTGVECGCRAYWRSTATYDCACGHHACYHDGDGRLSGLFAPPERLPHPTSSSTNDIMGDGRSSMVPGGGLLPTVEPTVQPTACADSGKADSPMPPADHAVGTPESYASTSYLPRLPSFINNHSLTLPQLLSDSMPFGNEAAGLGLRLPPPEGLERNGLTMSPTVAHFAPEDTTIIAGDSLARALRAYQPSVSNQDIPSTRHPSPARNDTPTGQGYEQAADLAMANAIPPRMPPPILPKQNISPQQNCTPLPPVFTP